MYYVHRKYGLMRCPTAENKMLESEDLVYFVNELFLFLFRAPGSWEISMFVQSQRGFASGRLHSNRRFFWL